ncbi:YCF48-related protein [Candidatus Poribacteria bacterium]
MGSQEEGVGKRFCRPFPHLIWTWYWATFSERGRVAQQLGYSLEELEAAIKQYPWKLRPPPALALGESDFARAKTFGEGTQTRFDTTDFIYNNEGVPPAVITHVTLIADDAGLRLAFRCAESDMNALQTRAVDPDDHFQRQVLDGDVYALYRQRADGQIKVSDLIKRALTVPPRERSVYEDDCVFVRFTPLAVGEDLSREFLVRDQRSPADLLQELGPAEIGRLQLEGSFYTVAMNAAGLVHSSFFDPWDGGRFWGCWDPNLEANCEQDTQGWEVILFLPLEELEPQLSSGAVWGIDIYRHRPARSGQPDQLLRTRDTIILRFDGDGRRVEQKLRQTMPLDEASMRVWPAMWERTEVPPPEAEVVVLSRSLTSNEWPMDTEWQQAAPLTPFRDHRSGQPVIVQTEVRLLQNSEYLFVRFDCDEPDPSRQVVSRKQEIAAYPTGHRAVNWLDRREHFGGPNWGDHVELQLAPGLDSADPYHNGYYLLLMNSQGDLIERYFDPCGGYSVDVKDWSSHARKRVKVEKDGWSAELAIPWSSFHSLESAGQTWFANFRRDRSDGNNRGEIQKSAWAVPYGTIREPGVFGRIRLNVVPKAISDVPKVPRFWSGEVKTDLLDPNCDRSRDCLIGLSAVGDNAVLAIGTRGTVWRSAPDGSSWSCFDTGVEFNLQRVQFVDSQHGWAVGGWVRDKRVAICGGMGVILVSSDGGHTWQTQWRGKGPWLHDLHFVNLQVGYVCGGYGTVLKTTDGGQTWHGPLPTGTSDWLYGIHFVDELQGWAVGSNEALLHTSDGGLSWQRQNADHWRRPRYIRERLRSVCFVDAKHGWTVGGHGTILHTDNGGINWRRQSLPLPDEVSDLFELRDIHFLNCQVGWAVGEYGKVVLRTDDGGRQWNLEQTGFRGFLYGVRAADRNNVWAVGERGARLTSRDGGRTWTAITAEKRPSWIFLTPHDHHMNGMTSLFAATADIVDWAAVYPARGSFLFEPYTDYQEQRWIAGTQSIGATTIRCWGDFKHSRRRRPHFIHHAYQIYGGTRPLERRLVALIRLTQPDVIITEFPIFAEDYWAWETALVARCAHEACFNANDPKRFPELSTLGLEPWQPVELYSLPGWSDQIYGTAAITHRLELHDGLSRRLGRSRLKAVQHSMAAWEGLMDRGTKERKGWWRGKMELHLVHCFRDGEGLERLLE